MSGASDTRGVGDALWLSTGHVPKLTRMPTNRPSKKFKTKAFGRAARLGTWSSDMLLKTQTNRSSQ
jgi:hypothetical protein